MNHRVRYRRNLAHRKLETLRALVIVEIDTIKMMEPQWEADSYLLGRVMMGEFILSAIDDRLADQPRSTS